MSLSDAFLVIAQLGAQWVLCLLLVLSTASVAIVFERGWFFWKRRLDGDELAKQIFYIFRTGNLAKARAVLLQHNSAECAVLAAGLVKLEHGLQAADNAMQSARLRERMRMECNLGLLGAIASAAPIVGLFGTVLGIVGLLDFLAQAPADQPGVSRVLMAEMARALVTTGVGFFVAIPAAAACKLFERRVRSSLAQIDWLVHLVLSQMPALSQTQGNPPEQTSKAA